MAADTLTLAQERRVVAGLVAQPFVAFGVGFALFPLVEFVNRTLNRGRSGDMMDAAFAFAAGAAVVAFFVTIFAAAPTAVWSLRRGRVTFNQALGTGALLGNLPLAVILLLQALASSMSTPPPSSGGAAGLLLPLGGLVTMALAAAFGMAGAAVFWLIVARERVGANEGDDAH